MISCWYAGTYDIHDNTWTIMNIFWLLYIIILVNHGESRIIVRHGRQMLNLPLPLLHLHRPFACRLLPEAKAFWKQGVETFLNSLHYCGYCGIWWNMYVKFSHWLISSVCSWQCKPWHIGWNIQKTPHSMIPESWLLLSPNAASAGSMRTTRS